MKIIVATFLFLCSLQFSAQEIFMRKDSLQGGLRLERTAYNVLRYDLNIKVNPDERFIIGYNDMTFELTENSEKIQIDLFENMSVDSIVLDKSKLDYKREFGAVFISLPKNIEQKKNYTIRFWYSGKPLSAKRAPWDGGFDWKKDKNGKHFIGVAVQGTGASLWYPCKDSQTDEPDLGATIKVAVPNGLMNVSNGRFKGSEDLKNGYTRWDWELKNPINNYDITVNIADYVHIHDNYKGLDLDYYVLRDNKEKAQTHFEEVKPMMACFQSKFGNYPFMEDGFKLVETPYLGMEHQSAIAYGNNFKKGYDGNDISRTGIGLLFDYIIVHESGHEWFGNSITSKDIADMWIHESFTMYSEFVYVECRFGYEKAMQYAKGIRGNIANDKPIIGHYGVNNEGSSDMYYKGALMVNSLRHVIDDDAKWWKILLKFSETFKHQIIDTQEVISFFNVESNMNLTPIFDQYLRTVNIPVLTLTSDKNKLIYKWNNANPDFDMPIDIFVKGNKIRIYPAQKSQEIRLKKGRPGDFKIVHDDILIDVISN